MQKNWYIIYTRCTREKKVAMRLKRQKIESFLPMCPRQTQCFGKPKDRWEPLFHSYVFAYAEQDKIEELKAMREVISVVFWKDKPAIISEEEIKALKDFLGTYTYIYAQRTGVNSNKFLRTVNNSLYAIHGNVLSIKNSEARINLPSLGFSLVARATENPLSKQNNWQISLSQSLNGTTQSN